MISFHHELNKNVFVLLCKAAACLDIISITSISQKNDPVPVTQIINSFQTQRPTYHIQQTTTKINTRPTMLRGMPQEAEPRRTLGRRKKAPKKRRSNEDTL